MNRSLFSFAWILSALVVCPSLSLSAQNIAPCSISSCSDNAPAISEIVLREIKTHISLGEDPSQISVSALQPSGYAGFQSAVIAIDKEKKHTAPVFVSTSGSYITFGSLYDVKSESRDGVISDLKDHFSLPSQGLLSVSSVKASLLPALDEWTLLAGSKDLGRKFLMLHDGQTLISGPMLVVGGRYNGLINKAITKRSGPEDGDKSSPVTIVEYSDLECTACKQMHELLAVEILKKYRGKVRIIYREFPMTTLHPWALVAARTAQCIYDKRPDLYLAFRESVYEHQEDIAGNPEQSLFNLAKELHLDGSGLASCVASEKSLERIQADVFEGGSVGVATTPTMFINGEEFIGAPPRDLLFHKIDEMLTATLSR